MKKKPLKILRIVLLVLVILIVGAIVMVNLFADGAIKAGIEVAGTKTLGVGVSVGEVDLAIMEGKLSFGDVVVDNPPGYKKDEKLLELKEGRIGVEVSSLLGDTVKISEIKLDGMVLVLEQKGRSNNLQEIIKNIPKAEEVEDEKAAKNLQIDELEITNVTVKVKLLPLPGRVDTLPPLKLAPIKMKDLGSDSKLDIAELTGKILVAIAKGVAKQGAGVLPDEMINTMKSTLGISLDIGKGVIKDGTNIGKGVLKGAEDVGKGITGGLKGLLKKKKKE